MKSLALVVSIGISGVIVGFAFGSEYGVLALILLFFSFSTYFFPTYYELAPHGVKISFLLFSRLRKWEYYSRYSERRGGVFLSPFTGPSRLDSFRGDFLRTGGKISGTEVLSLVRRYLK